MEKKTLLYGTDGQQVSIDSAWILFREFESESFMSLPSPLCDRIHHVATDEVPYDSYLLFSFDLTRLPVPIIIFLIIYGLINTLIFPLRINLLAWFFDLYRALRKRTQNHANISGEVKYLHWERNLNGMYIFCQTQIRHKKSIPVLVAVFSTPPCWVLVK